MGVFIRRVALGCALTVMMALAVGGVAQAAWAPSNALTGARYNHTATKLDDGRVLVVGGNNSAALATAELYDPATSAWSSAGSMGDAQSRTGQAAVLLNDGTVLVAGGDAHGTSQLYDPATNGWQQPAVAMRAVRFRPTMTLLDDGRVLVAGGAGGNSSSSLDSAEIYDPTTGDWSDTDPMTEPRQDATATLLPDGDVLVAGGWDGHQDLNSAELYHPGNGKWTAANPLNEARDSATATALKNGDVLVAGGGTGPGGTRAALTSAEVYDANAHTWHTVSSMKGAREKAAATLLDDGTVLVAGGDDPAATSDALASAEDYDPGTDTWTDAGPMTTARNQLTLTALANGRAIAVGGNPAGFDAGLASVERFSTASTTLTDTSFGGVLVGNSSDVATATFTNTGKQPLNVSTVSIGGASASSYSIVPDADGCSGQTVAPDATCQISVSFTPAAAGNRSATLTVADDSTAAGSTTAALAGVGTTSPAPPASGDTGAAPSDGGAAAGADAAAAAAAPAGGAVLGTKASSGTKPKAAHATCTTKTTRSHGRKRSTVTCKLTWPNGSGALTTRLMSGKKVVATVGGTARAGQATLRLNASRKLKSGRYTVVVTRGKTVVLSQTIRVS